jgi:hypothetical protein
MGGNPGWRGFAQRRLYSNLNTTTAALEQPSAGRVTDHSPGRRNAAPPQRGEPDL